MPYTDLHVLCPALARAETRSISVLNFGSESGAPPGDYGFCEMYCDEPGCDCRRVIFRVLSRARGGTVAHIGWGWEEASYYLNWITEKDPARARQMQGPELEVLCPQSDIAPFMLNLFKEFLLPDTVYCQRIISHYRSFRAIVEQRARRRKW